MEEIATKEAKLAAGELKQVLNEYYKEIVKAKRGVIAIEKDLDDKCRATLGRKLDDLWRDYLNDKKAEEAKALEGKNKR